jgi:hypothetical protein
LGLLSLLHLADDIAAKAARFARVLTGAIARWPLHPVGACFAPSAAVFAPDHLAISARFGTGGGAPFAPVLRFGWGSVKGKRQGQRQGCQRTTRCRIELHCSDSRIAGPPQAACLGFGCYAAQTVAGMNRPIEIHKKRIFYERRSKGERAA